MLKADGNLTFTEAYLLHILDDPLSQILKRLRQEHAARTTKNINRRYISFYRGNDWTRLPVTGEAFRAAVEAACHGNIHHYAAKKREQIERLGFEPNAYSGSFRLTTKNPKELVDVFLGQKKMFRFPLFG